MVSPKRNLNFKWWLIVGGFGFFFGYFGPLIFAPGSNQGPLLGIFITGPLGMVMGTLGWFFSYVFNWHYRLQIRVAIGCCALIVLGLIVMAIQPKAEWPGRIYQIQVTKCSSSSQEGESSLETIVLHERQIKREKSLFKPSFYRAGEVTYAQPSVVKDSFYIKGSCAEYPVGFTGTYYNTNHPLVVRDKAVLEPLPEFAKGL